MKRFLVAAPAVLLTVGLAVADDEKGKAADAPKAEAPAGLKTTREKASYGIGLSIGKSFKGQSADLDADLVSKGIKDGLAGGKALLTDAQIEEAVTEFRKEMVAKMADAAKGLAEKNRKDGEKFLADNKKTEGVKTTESGLQYKVLKKGAGKTPKKTDTVVTNYEGTLIDGTVFDSSIKRGKPATFPVDGVIAGWTEALQLMKVGDKWQLFIPANLAYGENPRPGGPIGPNSTLIFEIELLDIE